MAKFRLVSVKGSEDGGGNVAWSILALDNNDFVIPGKKVTIYTPFAETNIALQQGPMSLIALLRQYVPDGWDPDSLNAEAVANLNAANVAQDVRDFVESLGGFPKAFSI